MQETVTTRDGFQQIINTISGILSSYDWAKKEGLKNILQGILSGQKPEAKTSPKKAQQNKEKQLRTY